MLNIKHLHSNEEKMPQTGRSYIDVLPFVQFLEAKFSHNHEPQTDSITIKKRSPQTKRNLFNRKHRNSHKNQRCYPQNGQEQLQLSYLSQDSFKNTAFHQTHDQKISLCNSKLFLFPQIPQNLQNNYGNTQMIAPKKKQCLRMKTIGNNINISHPLLHTNDNFFRFPQQKMGQKQVILSQYNRQIRRGSKDQITLAKYIDQKIPFTKRNCRTRTKIINFCHNLQNNVKKIVR